MSWRRMGPRSESWRPANAPAWSIALLAPIACRWRWRIAPSKSSGIALKAMASCGKLWRRLGERERVPAARFGHAASYTNPPPKEIQCCFRLSLVHPLQAVGVSGGGAVGASSSGWVVGRNGSLRPVSGMLALRTRPLFLRLHLRARGRPRQHRSRSRPFPK